MNDRPINLTRRVRRGALGVLAAAALVAGATWHGTAAVTQPAQTKIQTTPTITRVMADGRESYADIVKVVAPAVVTIRVQGRARVAPTQFQFDDNDDLFRRFFGNPD